MLRDETTTDYMGSTLSKMAREETTPHINVLLNDLEKEIGLLSETVSAMETTLNPFMLDEIYNDGDAAVCEVVGRSEIGRDLADKKSSVKRLNRILTRLIERLDV